MMAVSSTVVRFASRASSAPSAASSRSEGRDEDKDLCQVHRLPCSVSHDGPAQISAFFDSRISKQSEHSYRSFFRGRALVGKPVRLPEGYCGYVVRSDLGADSSTVIAREAFDRYVDWNWNPKVESNRLHHHMQDWLSMSHRLHQSVPLDSQKQT